jgi:hypothetical protein
MKSRRDENLSEENKCKCTKFDWKLNEEESKVEEMKAYQRKININIRNVLGK